MDGSEELKLNLRGTRISDGTLAIISQLPQLESLDIGIVNEDEQSIVQTVPAPSGIDLSFP